MKVKSNPRYSTDIHVFDYGTYSVYYVNDERILILFQRNVRSTLIHFSVEIYFLFRKVHIHIIVIAFEENII